MPLIEEASGRLPLGGDFVAPVSTRDLDFCDREDGGAIEKAEGERLYIFNRRVLSRPVWLLRMRYCTWLMAV